MNPRSGSVILVLYLTSSFSLQTQDNIVTAAKTIADNNSNIYRN